MRTAGDFERAARASRGVALEGVTVLDSLEGPIRSALARVKDGNAAYRYLLTLIRQDERVYRAELAHVASLFARAYGPDPLRVAMALHRWVQLQVKFTRERVETFRSPVYTMRARFGDCDDSARLLVGLYRAGGMTAKLDRLDRPNGTPKHVFARVVVGGRAYAAETTIPARFGEEPLDAARRLLTKGRADLVKHGGKTMSQPPFPQDVPRDIAGVTDSGGQLEFDPGTYGLRIVLDATHTDAELATWLAGEGFVLPIQVWSDAAKLPATHPDLFDGVTPEIPDGWRLAFVQVTAAQDMTVNRVTGYEPFNIVDAAAWPKPQEPAEMPANKQKRWMWNKAWFIAEAWRQIWGETPTRHQAYLALAVAIAETTAGDAWPHVHNWGAVQKRSPTAAERAQLGDPRDYYMGSGGGHKTPPTFLNGYDADGIGRFLWVDANAAPGGGWNPYWVFFVAMPNDLLGAKIFLQRYLVKAPTTRELMLSANALQMATAMKVSYRYGVSIASYAKGIQARLDQLTPLLVDWDPSFAIHDPIPPDDKVPGVGGGGGGAPSPAGAVGAIVASSIAFVFALGAAAWAWWKA